MLIIAPKQGTYQLEQQLLAETALAGYTRLRIVSFEGLADFILSRLRNDAPKILDEEGRVMVLRYLLARHRDSLKVFRASARLTGFAQQLSLVLREFQGQQVTPQVLELFAKELKNSEDLAAKLQDLAALLQCYLDWLKANSLQDSDSLLSLAANALQAAPPAAAHSQTAEKAGRSPLSFSHIWVDGFSDFSERELDLLAALLPGCEQASVTFCLDPASRQKHSWLSHWSMVSRTYENCRKRLSALPGADTETEYLRTDVTSGRFNQSPVLQHMSEHWGELASVGDGTTEGIAELRKSLRIAACANPEGEARLAAREILRHVRAGGRYREIAVIVRHLDSYHSVLQRILSRYGIPFFIDRRESVAHHPLAELTRSAMRTIAFGWRHEDWFAALKSGLMPCQEKDVDLLENEALARGWKGNAWLKPIQLKETPKTDQDRDRLRKLEDLLERIRREAVLPFESIILKTGETNARVSGPQLAAAIRGFWDVLRIEEQLARWKESDPDDPQLYGRLSVHETVWSEVNTWLDNAELAFPDETLTLKEWLPILEAGLANLTVGIIPPSLDQVLVGAIDRSRTPDIKLALVLGLNETIFPALPPSSGLLSEADRLQLEQRNLVPGSTARQHLSREHYLAYIACTRPRERLVLTSSLCDAQGAPLNQSTFLAKIRGLFPLLEFETEPDSVNWQDSEHTNELIVPLLKMQAAPHGPSMDMLLLRHGGSFPLSPSEGEREGVRGLMGEDPSPRPSPPPNEPARQAGSLVEHLSVDLTKVIEQVRQLQSPQPDQRLSPDLAARLYGPTLRSSVSRMEQFAACPFKFFAHSGLRAEERKLFELDVREQGSFQHDVLALFHQELQAEGKRWRELTPLQARERVAGIGKKLAASYREGLLQANEQTRFMARVLTESLQDFVEILVGWMGEQYQFEPVAVELGFGTDATPPAWTIDLGRNQKLELYGRIDRVDLHKNDNDEALCVVVDYKSSQKQLDPLLIANGLQLQLLTYLNVLRHWPSPDALFGVRHLSPAGVFYVNLRGRYERQPNRNEALADPATARKLAYQHSGRFDANVLGQLDCRPGVRQGDQFNFRITQAGKLHKGSREALTTAEFEALLRDVEQNLKDMGTQIFSGLTAVAPYRKGTETACVQCNFRSICRVDPWTHPFRILKPKVGGHAELSTKT
jgi:ATP-dependent helicase/nuclease subunit B